MSDLVVIHTIVFDLDDTLYPEAEYVRSGFEAVDEWLKYCHNISGFFPHAWEYFSIGGRGDTFNRVLDKLDVKYDPTLIQGMIDVYRKHLPRICLYNDALTFICWAESKYNLAIITDGPAFSQNQKIKALNLRTHFGLCVVTDDLGRHAWKPSTIPYEAVMNHFQGVAGGYVYIADNPLKDFIGAKRLGWKTIRIRREGTEHFLISASTASAPDYTVSSLLDLPSLIFR